MSINNLSKYGKCRENSCVCIGRCSASEWPELLIQYNKYSPKKFKASRYATFIISQLSATHVLSHMSAWYRVCGHFRHENAV